MYRTSRTNRTQPTHSNSRYRKHLEGENKSTPLRASKERQARSTSPKRDYTPLNEKHVATISNQKKALRKKEDYTKAKKLLSQAVEFINLDDIEGYISFITKFESRYPKSSHVLPKLKILQQKLELIQKYQEIKSPNDIINEVKKGVYGYEQAKQLLQHINDLQDLESIDTTRIAKDEDNSITLSRIKEAAIAAKQFSAELQSAKETLNNTIRTSADNIKNLQRPFTVARLTAEAVFDDLIIGESDSSKKSKLKKLKKTVIEELAKYEKLESSNELKKLAKKTPKLFKAYLRKAHKEGLIDKYNAAKQFKKKRIEITNQTGRWDRINNTIALPNGDIIDNEIRPSRDLLPDTCFPNKEKGFCSNDASTTHGCNMWISTINDENGETIIETTRHAVHSSSGINDKKERILGSQNRAKEELMLIWEIKQNRFLELHKNENRTPQQENKYNRLKDELIGKRPLYLNALGLETATSLATLDMLKSRYIDHMDNYNRANEPLHIEDQMNAWHALSQDSKLQLSLKPQVKEALKHTSNKVKPQLKPITMNFGVNGPAMMKAGPVLTGRVSGWKAVEKANAIGMAQLFTHPDINPKKPEKGIITDSKTKISQISEVSNNDLSSSDIDTLIAQFEQLGCKGPVMDAIKEEQNDKRQRVMLQLLRDVASIYTSESYKTNLHDPYKLVARLAVLGSMTGIHISFNCKSGKDRTGVADVMIKFFAYKAYKSANSDKFSPDLMPDPNEDYSLDDCYLLAKFFAETGNLEVQQANTGVPGSKAGKAVFDIIFRQLKEHDPEFYEELFHTYNGLSSVAS